MFTAHIFLPVLLDVSNFPSRIGSKVLNMERKSCSLLQITLFLGISRDFRNGNTKSNLAVYCSYGTLVKRGVSVSIIDFSWIPE